MAEDNYEDGQDMMEIDFSGLNQGRKGGDHRSIRNHSHPRTSKKALLFAGAALLITLVIIAIVLFAGNGSSGKSIAAIQARLKALEEKVTRFSAIETNVTTVQQQEEALRQSVSGLQSSVKELKGTLDNVSREMTLLNKKMGTTPGRTKGTMSKKKEPMTKAHPSYHVVRKGESLYRIAKKYGISVNELYRLNNLSAKSTLHPGQKLMVTPNGTK
jgi:LysM repeat protein